MRHSSRLDKITETSGVDWTEVIILKSEPRQLSYEETDNRVAISGRANVVQHRHHTTASS